MPEKWTGRLIGQMHNEKITYADIAKELNVTTAYVSMILNGARKPAEAREKLEGAVKAIKQRRAEEQK